ncbi:MAG: IclR family transcriptional regulator [Granulosicoccus sp.]|nr:IclR family transcriptional regulator [Granulosicoccus sp.]
MEKELAEDVSVKPRRRNKARSESSASDQPASVGTVAGRTAGSATNSEGKARLGGFSRAIRLLDEITAYGPLRFAELEERLKLPKATLHRALNDLILERLITFDERSLNYSAGFRILELANQVWARSDIRSLARDQLEKLCDICNETVQLSVMADLHTVYIDSVESSNNVRMSMSVGNKVPIYCSGPGKLLLAWCALDEQKSIIERLSFAEFTLNTITQRDVLLANLKDIRQQGYAHEDEEHFAGIRAIAAPIVDRAGNAVAAISITAPTFRIEPQRFDIWREALVKAAADVSARLAPATRM